LFIPLTSFLNLGGHVVYKFGRWFQVGGPDGDEKKDNRDEIENSRFHEKISDNVDTKPANVKCCGGA
jgi:hypothetical protein